MADATKHQVTDEVREHVFDGIAEYDNPLPRWWVWLFYLTIAWTVVYIPYMHWGPGDLPQDEYAKEMAAYGPAKEAPKLSPEELQALTQDAAVVAEGKGLYDSRCANCHGPDGGGLVGPNLTDEFWLHGDGSVAEVLHIVNVGVPDKGMLAWKDQLKPAEVQAVSAYVVTLQGTTPANPKAPQGERVTAAAP